MSANARNVSIQMPASSQDLHHMMAATVAWFQAHALEILIAIAAGTAIYFLLAGIKQKVKPGRDEIAEDGSMAMLIRRALGRTAHFFMMMVAARLVIGYANPPEMLATTIRFLFTIASVFQVAIWVREIILGLIERRTGVDGHGETLANAMGIIRVLVTVALFSIALIVVLDNLGVNVTGLVAGLGVGGIAIGLAAQGIFSDLFAALSIIFDKPFRQGETINYDTTTATVERIGLKSTRMRAITGEKKIISNANLLQKEITSYQDLDHRRIKYAVGVIYQTSPEKCAQIPDILKEIVEANGGRFVRAGFVGFGDSSLNFEVEMDIYLDGWDAIYACRHNIGIGILKRFNEEGLEFAYPTQTTFTSAPDGTMIMPYPDVQPVRRVDKDDGER